METPRGYEEHGDGPGLQEQDPVREVYLDTEGEDRVYAALTRLQGATEFWCGSQADLAREAGYSDGRAVRGPLRRLELLGLLSTSERPGYPKTYFLAAAAPDGVPYLVRRRAMRSGRDVVRGARGTGVASSQIAALVASLRGSSEGGITTPDQGGGSPQITTPDHPGSDASVSSGPSMSSSSSSIRPPSPLLRTPPPPAPPHTAGVAEAAGDDGQPALPEGWEDVVLTLVDAGVEPEAWLVKELAGAPDPSVWEDAIERYCRSGRHATSPAAYILAVYQRTSLPSWEFRVAIAEVVQDDERGSASFTTDADPFTADARPPAGSPEAFTEAGDPSTTTTPTTAQHATPDDVSREPTQREAKAVWVAEMQRAPRPVLEVTLPRELERPVVRATEVVLRASRSLVQGFRALRGQRRRPRGGS